MRFIDQTGNQYTRLTVIEYAGKNKHGNSLWLCQCECGKTKEVLGTKLITGATQSCGCWRAKHGHAFPVTKTYAAWNNMKARCYNKKNEKYHRYGARGITVCDRWKDSFENFLADMGEAPERMTIDRIDNDGNYEKSNCRWASPVQQANNRSNNI